MKKRKRYTYEVGCHIFTDWEENIKVVVKTTFPIVQANDLEGIIREIRAKLSKVRYSGYSTGKITFEKEAVLLAENEILEDEIVKSIEIVDMKF